MKTTSIVILPDDFRGPPGPPGPPGPSIVVLDIDLPIILFTDLPPDADFSWTEVDIECYAALIMRFTLISSSTADFAFKITSQPLGTGEDMFSAGGMPSTEYKISWPWWFNNDESPREKRMYIGVRNLGSVPSTFTITDFRGYSLEVDP